MVVCSSKDRKITAATKHVLLQLRENGYHAVLVCPKAHPIRSFAHNELINTYEIDLNVLNIKKLLKIITNEDINLIHRMDNSGTSAINLTYTMSAAKLPVSVLVVKNNGRDFSSIEDIISFYKESFHKAVI